MEWRGAEPEAGAPALARRRPDLQTQGPQEAPHRARRRGTETPHGPVPDARGQLRFPVRRDFLRAAHPVLLGLDEYTRTALAIIPRRSFKAADVVAVLEDIIAETGTAPTYVRCDNGPEFTAAALIDWCDTAGGDTAFIDPGSPWQNGFIESFDAQFRREHLAGEIMDTMAEAKYLADEWKAIYNHERPHGSLDGMTPNRYWENWTQEYQLAIA
jgi:transposase InsO family protein